MNSFARYDSGLTLVELMIVMVLTLALMSAAYMAYHTQSESSENQQEVASIQQDIRAVMNIISRDIREAGIDPKHESLASLDRIKGIVGEITDIGGTRVVSGEHQIYIQKDLSEDGVLDDTNEIILIDYAVTATSTLTRTDVVSGETQKLASNVRRFDIVYRDENNNILSASTDKDNARILDITLVMRSDRVNPSTGQYTQREIKKKITRRNYRR